MVVAFFTERAAFERRLDAILRALDVDGGLWVAWPKKASKVSTDVTEDTVREVCLPLGLVDNKVCAIDDVWSGLRVVWRKGLRPAKRAEGEVRDARSLPRHPVALSIPVAGWHAGRCDEARTRRPVGWRRQVGSGGAARAERRPGGFGVALELGHRIPGVQVHQASGDLVAAGDNSSGSMD